MNSKKAKRSQPELKYHASKKKPKKLSVEMAEQPRILIVGAGVAGLACAVKLLEYEFENIQIVEASNRIGGRISSEKFGNGYVDMGAQWVHGQVENVIYEQVYNLDILDSSKNQYVKVDWIRSNGDPLPETTVKTVQKIIGKIFNKESDEISNFEGAFSTYITEEFKKEVSGWQDVDAESGMEVLKHYLKMEGSTKTSIQDELSCEGYCAFKECSGDSMLNFKNKGFIEYIKVLIGAGRGSDLGVIKNKVDFNTRVTKIDWDNVDGTIIVSCANGKLYTVDHVIVTMSLGVLKRNMGLFQPNLPSDKRRAMNYMSFGHICKIYLEFKEAFWPFDWNGFAALWTEEDMKKDAHKKHDWVFDIVGFYTVKYQPQLLQTWLTGPNVEYVETIASENVCQDIYSTLKKFLPEWNVTKPINLKISKFTTDQNFLGSYSYPSMLTKRYYTGPDELMQPINVMAFLPSDSTSIMTLEPMTVRPLILFAGEATSENHFATVHGAVETGEREALRLSGYYWKDL